MTKFKFVALENCLSIDLFFTMIFSAEEYDNKCMLLRYFAFSGYMCVGSQAPPQRNSGFLVLMKTSSLATNHVMSFDGALLNEKRINFIFSLCDR